MKKPSALTILQRNPMKLRSWKTLFFEIFFFLLIFNLLDFVFVIVNLEVFFPHHTWNINISSNLVLLSSKLRLIKPWFYKNHTSNSDVLESNPHGEDEDRNHRSLVNPKFSIRWLKPWSWHISDGKEKMVEATTLYLSRWWKTKTMETLTLRGYL